MPRTITPVPLPQAEHDLLIEIKVKVESLTDEVKNLKDNIVGRVEEVEEVVSGWKQLKETRDKEMADHETRIRRLEYFVTIATGAVLILEAYLKYFNK